MRTGQALRAAFAAILVAATATLAGCSKEPKAGAAAPPPPPVVVATPEVQRVVDYDEFTGRTDAVEAVDVRAQVSGYIAQVAFQDGSVVKAGDLLFQIDDRPYVAQLNRATAEVERVTAVLTKSKNEFARLEQPFKTGAVSALEYDNQQQVVKSNEAALAAAKAELEAARLNVEYCKVTAPIHGRVSRPLVTAGNLVSSQTPLTSIVSITPVYVYYDVDERTMLYYQSLAQKEQQRPEDVKQRQIKVGMARANDQEFPFEGILDFVDNRVDASTGTVKVRAVFQNDSGVLVPGLFVRVRMQRAAPADAMVVPERALGNDQGRRFVFVVDDQNTVQYRPVEVGPLVGTKRVVKSGLSPTDRVIVDGVQRARTGGKVTPQPAPATPATQPVATGCRGQTVPAAS